MASITEKITEVLKPTIEAMGFELWGVEFNHIGRHSTLILYIDSDKGVSIDDCSDVSRQVSSILDVEDVISYAYDLEVSSPGLDRMIFNLEQMKKYLGSMIKVELNMPVDNHRSFKGVLESIEDNILTFTVMDGMSLEVLYSNVKKARLVPIFDKKEKK